jgi:NADH:ubiquinone oxidoreductase subunit C
VTEVLAHKGRALTPEETEELLRDRLGEHVQRAVVEYGVFTLWISPDGWLDAARRCREERLLAYDMFDSLFGIDAREDGFEVVAVLYSTSTGNRIALRARCEGGREAPSLPSIAEVYRGADWMERETYDMFGVDFPGHPGLEPRILTVENFEGWPLRKDFHLASRAAKPWPGVAEPVELDDEGNKIERERAIGDAPGPYELDKAMAEQAKRVNAPPAPAVEPEAEPVEAPGQPEAAVATATTGAVDTAEAGSDEGGAGGDPAARAKAKAEERRKRQAEARAAKARARADKAQQAEGGPAPAAEVAGDEAPSDGAAEVAGDEAPSDGAAEVARDEAPSDGAAEQPGAGQPEAVPVAEGEDEDVDPRVAARRKRQAEARAARAKARADRAGGADGATGSAPAAAEGASDQGPAEGAEPSPADAPPAPESSPAEPGRANRGRANRGRAEPCRRASRAGGRAGP